MRSLDFRLARENKLNASSRLSDHVSICNGAPKVFAVPRSEDHQYFALDFADRNQDKAEHVSIPDHATQVV